MPSIVFQGFLLGLILSVLVGVSFFVLLDTSIRYGFKKAISTSIGIFVSDALLLFVIWNVSKDLIENIISNTYFNIICSMAFIGIGIYYLFNVRKANIEGHKPPGSKKKLFLQGFAVNTLNPSVIVFWLGAMLFAVSKLNYGTKELIIYFASTLLVILITDLIKIFLASRLRQWISTKHIQYVYAITGVILVAVGVKIFIQ